MLPLLGDRLLLIGHDNGLSVLNMFPQEWTDAGLQTRGPGEAEAHPIWTGEGSLLLKYNLVVMALTTFFSVFQMTLLEMEEVGENTPHGVALFLVGSDPENGKEQESMRILRMYNLASLISLARWAISQKVCRLLFIGVLTLRSHVGRCAIESPQTSWLASTSVDSEEAQAFWQPSKGPEITHVRSTTARPRASIILSNDSSNFVRSSPEG